MAPVQTPHIPDKQTLAGPSDHPPAPRPALARNIPAEFQSRCHRHKDCAGAATVRAPPASADISQTNFPAVSGGRPHPPPDSPPESDPHRTTYPRRQSRLQEKTRRVSRALASGITRALQDDSKSGAPMLQLVGYKLCCENESQPQPSALTKIPTTPPSSNIPCRPPCSPYLSWSYAPKLPQDYSTDLAHSSSPSVSPAKTTVACASSLPTPIGPVSSPRNGPPSSPPAPFFLFFSRSRKSACPSSSLA